MRTTIDLPEELYRKTKATAAMRGTSMKELILHAVEREIDRTRAAPASPHRVKLPLIQSKSDRKLDLSDFDFDDLLS